MISRYIAFGVDENGIECIFVTYEQLNKNKIPKESSIKHGRHKIKSITDSKKEEEVNTN